MGIALAAYEHEDIAHIMHAYILHGFSRGPSSVLIHAHHPQVRNDLHDTPPRDSIKWNDWAERCCSNKSTRVEYSATMSTTCGNIIYIPETLQKHSNFSSKHVISLRLGQLGSQLFIYRFLCQIVSNCVQNLNPLIVQCAPRNR